MDINHTKRDRSIDRARISRGSISQRSSKNLITSVKLKQMFSNGNGIRLRTNHRLRSPVRTTVAVVCDPLSPGADTRLLGVLGVYGIRCGKSACVYLSMCVRDNFSDSSISSLRFQICIVRFLAGARPRRGYMFGYL